MKNKQMILLALGGVVVYFLFLKPKPKPQTGAGAIVSDLGKLIGDFTGAPAA